MGKVTPYKNGNSWHLRKTYSGVHASVTGAGRSSGSFCTSSGSHNISVDIHPKWLKFGLQAYFSKMSVSFNDSKLKHWMCIVQRYWKNMLENFSHLGCRITEILRDPLELQNYPLDLQSHQYMLTVESTPPLNLCFSPGKTITILHLQFLPLWQFSAI